MRKASSEFLATYPAVTVEIDVSVRIVDLIGENFDIALRVGIGPMKDDASLAAPAGATTTRRLVRLPQVSEAARDAARSGGALQS